VRDNSGDIPLDLSAIWVHNRQDVTTWFYFLSSPAEYLFTKPGTYDFMIRYSVRSPTDHQVVLREGIEISSGLTVIDVQRSESIYTFDVQGTDKGGKAVIFDLSESLSRYTYMPNPDLLDFVSDLPHCKKFSPVSPNYRFERMDHVWWRRTDRPTPATPIMSIMAVLKG